MPRGGRGRINWGFSKSLDRKKKCSDYSNPGLTAALGLEALAGTALYHFRETLRSLL